MVPGNSLSGSVGSLGMIMNRLWEEPGEDSPRLAKEQMSNYKLSNEEEKEGFGMNPR